VESGPMARQYQKPDSGFVISISKNG